MRNILAVVIGLGLGLPAFCQTNVNSVRVYTEPAGLHFTIDGQDFLSAGELLWPEGSKHIVTSFSQFGPRTTEYYEYQGWVTNLSPSAQPSNERPLSMSAELKWIKLVFKTSYAITVRLAPSTVPKQGRVEVGSGSPQAIFEFDSNTLFLQAGTIVILRAYPNPGYYFGGWGPGSGFSTKAFEISFVLDGPRLFTPWFLPVTATQVDAAVQTDPAGLEILADRTPYRAPVQLEWGWDTVHTVGAAELQMYNGVPYVFQSWSDGGGISHDVVVPAGSTRIDLIARFVRGASVIFRTSPQGLKLSVDGSQAWPAYDFTWAPNSSHTVSAPATQTDASGRKYEFVSWTGGKSATFSYTVAESGSADVLTATYRPVGQLSVTSDPVGLSLRIDGENCVTPCAVERTVGAAVQLIAPDAIQLKPGDRLLFSGWKDAAASTRNVTAGADPATYTAQFKQQFQLSLSSNPAGGAVLQTSPSSKDGYYDAATPVSVSATLNLGFRLLGWTGDVTGLGGSGAVLLDSPKSAVLQLEPLPAIAPPGVWNAAPQAGSRRVAAGSLISIYGVHLAPEPLAGSANPLPQTLGGVTVRVNDSFLPLLFVSPEQINAQLVSNLEPGPHKIIVRVEGKPEASIDFDVVRNAPGLFTRTVGDATIGMIVHGNGEPVTPGNPAMPGETLTVFGTGCGPYRTTPPDGFLVAESTAYSLADDAHVVVEGVSVDPLYAGRTNLAVGIDAIRFKLPSLAPASGSVQVKATINGSDSNTVSLPFSGGATQSAALGK